MLEQQSAGQTAENAEPSPAITTAASSPSTSKPVDERPSTTRSSFGLMPEGQAGDYRLPANVVAFEGVFDGIDSPLPSFLKALNIRPVPGLSQGDRRDYLYRIADPAFVDVLARSVPDGVTFIPPGGTMSLGGLAGPTEVQAQSIDELPLLTAAEISRVARAEPPTDLPPVTATPLSGHSLLGQSATFRANAIEAKPLLASLCMSGQVTTWYAAPNTGKTLIAISLLIDAVREARIAPGAAYYVNADDSSEGLATKMEIMDDLGVHTIVPGYAGFQARDLIGKLHEMAQRREAKGVFVLVDTAKKFAQLMDKKDSAAFGNACRQVAMAGGAVLNLAHTTKAPNADGSPRYTGTTDLVEDADAAYTIGKLELAADAGERVVEFRCFKRRGDNAESAAYAYAAENGVSYAERLASVHAVDPDALDQFKRAEAQVAEEDLLQAIAASIIDGVNTKMLLGKAAAARANVSERRMYRLIERYTGDDPAIHRWRFRRGERGKHVFELLPPPG